MTTPQALNHPNWVKLTLEAKNANEAIRELHSGLIAAAGISAGDAFLNDLLARQALDSACLDPVVAVPHARTIAVERTVCAVGRSEGGVYFSERYPSIRLVILIGVPPKAVTEYLRWLSHMAKALRKPGAREQLLAAPTPEELNAVWSRFF